MICSPLHSNSTEEHTPQSIYFDPCGQTTLAIWQQLTQLSWTLLLLGLNQNYVQVYCFFVILDIFTIVLVSWLGNICHSLSTQTQAASFVVSAGK